MSFWIVVDLSALLLSLIWVALRIAALAADDTDYIADADVFLGISIILFVVRMLEITLVYKPLGTLMLILQSILNELFRYIAFQATFLVAFGAGLSKLIQAANQDTFGPESLGNSSALNPEETKYFKDIASDLFFSLFGLIDTVEYDQAGFVLATYAVYLMVSAILLLNLLIAMLNKSYMDIERQADQEYKIKFSELVLTYKFVLPKVPPPISTVWRWFFRSPERKWEHQNADKYYKNDDHKWEEYNGMSHLQLFDAVHTKEGVGILKWIYKPKPKPGSSEARPKCKVGVEVTTEREVEVRRRLEGDRSCTFVKAAMRSNPTIRGVYCCLCRAHRSCPNLPFNIAAPGQH